MYPEYIVIEQSRLRKLGFDVSAGFMEMEEDDLEEEEQAR